MGKTISEIERQFPESSSWELEYWLGIAIRNYTSWFIRGDERKQYLQSAISHLEKAYALSDDPHRDDIACELGRLFIGEAIIRDLNKGISYLEKVYNARTDYVPALCSYAEAYYKLGQYDMAATIGFELHRRAELSQKWRDLIPVIAPLNIVAKSYRAQAKEYKKNGEIEKAISLLQKLVDMKLATDNDKKILENLLTSREKDG